MLKPPAEAKTGAHKTMALMRSATFWKADCSFSFDWKISQMAIGETPPEPLIALMNTDPSNRVAPLPAGTWVLLSVSSVGISGENFPPDRASVPAETDGPAGFPAETFHLFFHIL
jgi:hypothetical protein